MCLKASGFSPQGQADLLKHAKLEALDTLRQIHQAAQSCGLRKNEASVTASSPELPRPHAHAPALDAIPESETASDSGSC